MFFKVKYRVRAVLPANFQWKRKWRKNISNINRSLPNFQGMLSYTWKYYLTQKIALCSHDLLLTRHDTSVHLLDVLPGLVHEHLLHGSNDKLFYIVRRYYTIFIRSAQKKIRTKIDFFLKKINKLNNFWPKNWQ